MGLRNNFYIFQYFTCWYEFQLKIKPQVRMILVITLLLSILKCSLQTDLIAGDRITEPGEFPYQAFIRWDKLFKCGAVLVKVDYVIVALTISYCAAYWEQDHRSNTVQVIAGNTNVNKTAYTPTEQEANVVCHINNRLVPQHINNNLAILILGSDIESTTNVNVIEMSGTKLQSDDDLELIGWEKEAGINTNVNSEQQACELEAINFTECYYLLERQCERQLQKSLFCAKRPPKWNNYKGGFAVGSAVVNKQTGKLAGLLTYSAGLDCNGQHHQQEVPHLVVFVNIANYVSWIRDEVIQFVRGNHSVCAGVTDRSSRHLKPELDYFDIDK